MKTDLHMRLVHDGVNWICSNPSYQVQGENLAELDAALTTVLRNTGKYPPGCQLIVFMGYDFSTFPRWLRQYHSHYFNRILSIDL